MVGAGCRPNTIRNERSPKEDRRLKEERPGQKARAPALGKNFSLARALSEKFRLAFARQPSLEPALLRSLLLLTSLSPYTEALSVSVDPLPLRCLSRRTGHLAWAAI